MKIIKTNFKIKIISKIIIILVALFLALGSIYFLSKQIKRINASLIERKEMDYLVSNQEVINSKIRNEFSKIDPEYREKIISSLPSVYNILDFVDVMEGLADKHAYKQSLSFSPPVDAPEISGPIAVKVINFNLIINESNIENFISYLKEFENLPYFVSITSINQTSASLDGLQKNSSINISGRFYAKQ